MTCQWQAVSNREDTRDMEKHAQDSGQHPNAEEKTEGFKQMSDICQ